MSAISQNGYGINVNIITTMMDQMKEQRQKWASIWLES